MRLAGLTSVAVLVVSALPQAAAVSGAEGTALAGPAATRPAATRQAATRPAATRPAATRLTHNRAIQQLQTGTQAEKLAAVRFLLRYGTAEHQRAAFGALGRMRGHGAKALLFEVLRNAPEEEIRRRALMMLAGRLTPADRKKLAAVHAEETDPALKMLLAGQLARLAARARMDAGAPARPAKPTGKKRKGAKKRKRKWFSVGFLAAFGGGFSAPLAFLEVGLALRWGRMTFDFRAGGGFMQGTVALAMGMFSVYRARFRVRHGWTARFAAPTDFFYFGVWANLADLWVRVSDRIWFVASVLNVGWGNGTWQGTLELRMEF